MTSLYACISPKLKGGEYLNNCQQEPAFSVPEKEWLEIGEEPDLARWLWHTSTKIVGLTITLEDV
jgi:hypothetical protein